MLIGACNPMTHLIHVFRKAADHVCNISSVSDDVPDNFNSWTAGVDQAVTDNVIRYAGPDLPPGSSAPASRGRGLEQLRLPPGRREAVTRRVPGTDEHVRGT